MSHSFTIVILPKESLLEIESEVSRLLAPFNEELELPAWWEKCWCVGDEAEVDVRKQIDNEFGTINSVRDKFIKTGKGISQ